MTPTANDIDADNTSPQLLATVRGMPAGVPSLFAPGEMAVVNSTGLGYFASSALQLGVFDTAANAITGTIPWLGLPAPTSSAVNQSTHIVYFRAGNTLAAVDGRPGSPTFNQVILADAFAPASSGTILQSIVIDETRNLLYATSGGGQTAITIVDVNPDSPTFHQQLASVPIAGVAAPRGVAVNTLTNQIYVGTTSGLFVMDGVTRAVSAIANTPGTVFMPVVNETLNLVYATASGNLVYAIDGATNTRIAAISLSVLPATRRSTAASRCTRRADGSTCAPATSRTRARSTSSTATRRARPTTPSSRNSRWDARTAPTLPSIRRRAWSSRHRTSTSICR